MRSRLIITGAAGYLGSALCARTLDIITLQGRDVTLLDSFAYGGRGLLSQIADDTDVKLHVVDLCDPGEVEKHVREGDVVIHLAAIVGEPACDKARDRVWKTNVELTRALVARGAYVIFASTCSNYGRVVDWADEETTLAPLSEYARSKVEAEKAVLVVKGNVVFRFGTLYGVAPRTRLDLLVNELAFRLYRGETFNVYGAADWRPLCHVDVAVTLLGYTALKLLRSYGTDDQPEVLRDVYNVVTLNMTKREIVERMRSRYPELRVEFGGIGDGRSYRVRADRVKEDFPQFHEQFVKSTPSIEETIDQLFTYIHASRRIGYDDLFNAPQAQREGR